MKYETTMTAKRRKNEGDRRKVETRAVEEYGASAEATGDEHHYSTT